MASTSALAENVRKIPQRERGPWQFLPLKLALVWLFGTLVVFFMTEQATRVPAIGPLLAVAIGGASFLAIGYILTVRRERRASTVRTESRKVPNGLVLAAGCWSIIYALAILRYQQLGMGDILQALSNPGQAYKAKFEVFARAEVDPLTQLATLGSGFMTITTPVTIAWWRELSPWSRLVGVLGSLAFPLAFVGIGTNQGLGYAFLFMLVGVLVGFYHRNPGWRRPRLPKKAQLAILLALVAGLAFFVLGSITRSSEFQAERAPTNPLVSSLVGEDLSLAFDSVVFYPTHGYLGLSETLTQPFVFTQGYGGTRAANRYMVGYFGATDQFANTYPARTEYDRGYPSLALWHTIYPWLASDLTFPGAVIFMAAVGWLMARTWLMSVTSRDPLAIGLLAYLAIFVVFIPANNQIGTSQVNLIGFLSLFAIYVLRWVFRFERT